MTVTTKLTLFVLLLGAVFAAALGIGAAAGPFDDEPAPPAHTVHAP